MVGKELKKKEENESESVLKKVKLGGGYKKQKKSKTWSLMKNPQS